MNRLNLTITLLCSLSLVIISCSHYDELQSNGDVSSANGNSHNAGRNCMQCHHDSKNEASEKWWYVAGSIAGAQKGGVVQLWTERNARGNLLLSLPIDQSGNFYTEKIIDFKGGYYPIIIHGTDTLKMLEQVNGASLSRSCNDCHGNNGNGQQLPLLRF
jgi:hypothetical protein